MSQEKRSAVRAPYLCEVECAGSGGGSSIAHSRLSDLSATGAFVESLNELPVGTDLTLRFQGGSRQLQVLARVVHNMPQFGMGVCFMGLSPADQAEIERLVRDKS